MDQINELLREEIAKIVEMEIDFKNALITILNVDCSPDLSNAKIRFSVLPDNVLGTALEKLKKNSGNIAHILNKKIKLRKIPRLKWVFDNTEKDAAGIDRIFAKIEKGEDLSEEGEEIGFK